MKLYIKLDPNDPLEIPEAVADSVPELARLTGDKPINIYSALSHQKEGRKVTTGIRRGTHCKYKMIEVTDDDEGL